MRCAKDGSEKIFEKKEMKGKERTDVGKYLGAVKAVPLSCSA
jgi:hypothetical protein